MLLKKMTKKFKDILYSIPISVKITAWYTFFVVILISIITVSTYFVSDILISDVTKKELIESVQEIAEDEKKFESFDDGIFFIKYNTNNELINGIVPRNFDSAIPFSSKVAIYKNQNEEFFYYDAYLEYSNSSSEWVRGIFPISRLSKYVKIILTLISIFSPFLLFLIISGGYKIIKKSLRPVRQISDTALEIQEHKDFSKRIELGNGKDEIHKMAFVFNQMLDSLENSYIHEKQFSSDVSHELRTPVTVILAESDYALNYSSSLEEAKESFLVIQRQAKKMSTLINQIMELSKLEQQKNIDLQKLNLSKLIKTSLGDYKYIFERKKINLDFDIEDNLEILGNKLMLERVLDNLLSNALKFTKSKILVKLYKEDKIILEIIDDGIGLSKEQLEHIWDRFYQASSSRNKENNEGYGLGLSMVRKIVELHKACISVESELEKGAKFIIKF